MGLILMLVFVVICIFISWEYYVETEEMNTFASLAEMVEEQRKIDTGNEGSSSNSSENQPVIPRQAEKQTVQQKLVLNKAMQIASAGPISGAEMRSTLSTAQDYLVSDENGIEEKRILPQYLALYEQNPDLYGWIRIDGTKVNYPVMFSPQEPERYLSKDYYGKKAKYGVPFVDGATDTQSRNLLIHGHNARSGILFGDLDKYEEKSFWKEHRYIRFDTLYEERLYEIVAVCQTSALIRSDGVEQFFGFANIWDDISMMYYTQFLSRNVMYDTGLSIGINSELITLSTCSYHTKEGRLIIVAKRMKLI